MARRGAGQQAGQGVAVYVADTLGELGLAMRLAPVTFVAGSLQPGIGGHNPVEPVQLGSTVFSASFVGNNRVVFNIKGNDYRLVVLVRYDKGLMFVRFVGTHAQYDRTDVTTV